MTGVRRHSHTFHRLWWHFGPHGPQGVHVHSCWSSTECGGPGCTRVLIGKGKACNGKPKDHHRETLK